MASRPSTRRRKPGVATNTSRRQPLLRSESATVPRASETILKAPTNLDPLDLVKETLTNHGLPDTIPVKQQEPSNKEAEPDVQFLVSHRRRIQHRYNGPTDNSGGEQAPPKNEVKKPTTSLQYLQKLRSLEVENEYGLLNHNISKYLRVPKVLAFDNDGLTYSCKVKVQNMSVLNVTYTMKSTSLSIFKISNGTGWIPPMGYTTIVIKTRPEVSTDFSEIAIQKFVIFATPVFVEEQLDIEKIAMYWRAFGSDLFPREMAEDYVITTIVPKDIDNYSTLDLISIGWGRQKTKIEHNFQPVDPDTFHRVWELNGNLWAKNLSMDCHYRELMRNSRIRELKRLETKDLRSALCGGGLIVIAALCLFGLKTSVQIPPFGLLGMEDCFKKLVVSIGGELGKLTPPPQPPPQDWYEYIWSTIKNCVISIFPCTFGRC